MCGHALKILVHIQLMFNTIWKKVADGQIIYIGLYKILIKEFLKGLSK